MTLTDHIEALWRAAEADEPNAMLVLADALEEAGDPIAAGVRWLGENEKRPMRGRAWWWMCPQIVSKSNSHHAIPSAANERLLPSAWGNYERFEDAITAAARALVESGVA